MPQITLEYTSNLNEKKPDQELFLRLHAVLEETAGISVENCKSRWREVKDWVVGAGDSAMDQAGAFVHLEMRILEGRREELIQAIGREALALLESHFLTHPCPVEPQITVQVGEMRKATYFKYPSGTLGQPPTRKA